MSKSPRVILMIIFTTVLIDLIGFGMIIPLIGLYGRHYGAHGLELPLLGGIYSCMQFLFAPFWGRLSDRIGRRPVLLFSLAGSAISYVFFGLAPSVTWLIVSRAFGGICAANISTAHAAIADITPPEKRAQGMGLMGAAFGIGFTLGPPLGGLAAEYGGLGAPGWIAGSICACNWIVAFFRLPETWPREQRARSNRVLQKPTWIFSRLAYALRQKEFGLLLCTFFVYTFAFSNFEQTFSLLFQNKFGFDTATAGYKTGLVLMCSGLLGAAIQGGCIRKWVPRFGEFLLLRVGLLLMALTIVLFPFIPIYSFYFLLVLPLSLGSSLIHPTLSALLSKNTPKEEQGSTFGLSQSLGSLARALGPFCGLLTYALHQILPYLIGSVLFMILFCVHQRRASHA